MGYGFVKHRTHNICSFQQWSTEDLPKLFMTYLNQMNFSVPGKDHKPTNDSIAMYDNMTHGSISRFYEYKSLIKGMVDSGMSKVVRNLFEYTKLKPELMGSGQIVVINLYIYSEEPTEYTMYYENQLKYNWRLRQFNVIPTKRCVYKHNPEHDRDFLSKHVRICMDFKMNTFYNDSSQTVMLKLNEKSMLLMLNENYWNDTEITSMIGCRRVLNQMLLQHITEYFGVIWKPVEWSTLKKQAESRREFIITFDLFT